MTLGTFEQYSQGTGELARAIEAVLNRYLANEPDTATRGQTALEYILGATEEHKVVEMLEGAASDRVRRLLGRIKSVAASTDTATPYHMARDRSGSIDQTIS